MDGMAAGHRTPGRRHCRCAALLRRPCVHRLLEHANPQWLLFALVLQAAMYLAQAQVFRIAPRAIGVRLSRGFLSQLGLAKVFLSRAPALRGHEQCGHHGQGAPGAFWLLVRRCPGYGTMGAGHSVLLRDELTAETVFNSSRQAVPGSARPSALSRGGVSAPDTTLPARRAVSSSQRTRGWPRHAPGRP